MQNAVIATTKRSALAQALPTHGERAAREFDDFYRSTYARVVRSLQLVVGDADDAADAAQEAFARALRRWRSVRRTDRPEAWVFVVAIRYHRRRTRKDARIDDAARPPDMAVDPAANDARVSVAEALRHLTPRQRSMVVLRFHADLPVADIASAMGCAEGTVKATLHQALRAMRVDFDESDLA